MPAQPEEQRLDRERLMSSADNLRYCVLNEHYEDALGHVVDLFRQLRMLPDYTNKTTAEILRRFHDLSNPASGP